VDLALHDARSASAGFLRLALGVTYSGAPDRAVPLTPLSLPALLPGAFAPDSRIQVAKAASFVSP
jgi:hypothetical protein